MESYLFIGACIFVAGGALGWWLAKKHEDLTVTAEFEPDDNDE